jgi:hypothetical protein
MKNKGFIHLDLLLAIIVVINLFVLMTRILYNINNNYYHLNYAERLNYESILAKIEYDLIFLEGELNVQPESLTFSSNKVNYHYYLSKPNLILEIGSTTKKRYTFASGIDSIQFIDYPSMIEVIIVDEKGRIFKGIILKKIY